MGYSRQQFYEIRRNFQTDSAEKLIGRLPFISQAELSGDYYLCTSRTHFRCGSD